MRGGSCDPGHVVLLHRTCATILFPHSLIFFASFATWYERHHREVPGTLFMSASRISPLAPGVRSSPRLRETRSPAPPGSRGEWQCRLRETSFPGCSSASLSSAHRRRRCCSLSCHLCSCPQRKRTRLTRLVV